MIVFICNIIEEIQQDQYKGKEKRTMLLRSEIDEENIIDNTNLKIIFLSCSRFFSHSSKSNLCTSKEGN